MIIKVTNTKTGKELYWDVRKNIYEMLLSIADSMKEEGMKVERLNIKKL